GSREWPSTAHAEGAPHSPRCRHDARRAPPAAARGPPRLELRDPPAGCHLRAINLCASEAYKNARRIAVYMAMDGELDPTPLIMRCRTDERELYLPVLPPMEGAMSFRPYNMETPLVPNRFGIPEP